jgi:DnaK suppressor protein
MRSIELCAKSPRRCTCSLLIPALGHSLVLRIVSLAHTTECGAFPDSRKMVKSTVNGEVYKRQLKEKEVALLGQLRRAGQRAREPSDDTTRDAGDESIADEQKDEQLRGASADWATLSQVRQALQRIDDGIYGTCLVDGEPIEERRLSAIPWTAYCLRHQQEIDEVGASRKPTL